MLVLLVAAMLAASPASQANLDEAAHAIRMGRVDQARTMIARAVADGARGDQVDRLLAELAFVSGNFGEAEARFETLLREEPGNARFAEQAALAALRTGHHARAAVLARKATQSGRATWRAWNAQGVAADFVGDWSDADAAYARAEALAPNQAEIANNQGWSKLLRGAWEEAIAPLERAARLDPQSVRIADNLELARAALGSDLPRRRPGEAAEEWATRLNDAGVAAKIRGERARAVAAFAQAIEARTSWYVRAHNNLQSMDVPR